MIWDPSTYLLFSVVRRSLPSSPAMSSHLAGKPKGQAGVTRGKVPPGRGGRNYVIVDAPSRSQHPSTVATMSTSPGYNALYRTIPYKISRRRRVTAS